MQPNLSKKLVRTGRIFYSLALISYGLQTIISKDFRPALIPEFPQWIHTYSIFPYLIGSFLLLSGIITSGIIKAPLIFQRNTFLLLGLLFLLAILFCNIPLRLFVSPYKPTNIRLWAEALKELAFCGGAFAMANSFGKVDTKPNKLLRSLEKGMPTGRILFALAMILMGSIHFIAPTVIAGMFPKYFPGMTLFWTYIGGVALVGAGTAMLLNIWVKTTGILLSLTLFLWLFMFHLPWAISFPWWGNGNNIVCVFDALLFSGVALVIANTDYTDDKKKNNSIAPGFHRLPD